jgi:hypothetical protein
LPVGPLTHPAAEGQEADMSAIIAEPVVLLVPRRRA